MRLINNTLREFLDVFVIVYLDNILVFLQEEKEYIEYIKKVLIVIQERGMLLKPEKCKFYTKKVEFLGHIIILEGIGIDPTKVLSILD